MTIPSDKPLRPCPHCGKNVKNMGFHISNNHPSIMAQLEEKSPSPPPATPSPPPSYEKKADVFEPDMDIDRLIYKHLNRMLSLKFIEMIGGTNNPDITEIRRAMQPPQPPTPLSELKAYHDLVYKDNKREREEVEIPETGNQWIDLATQAIPLVRDLINKKQGDGKNVEHTRNEEANRTGDTKLQLEAPRDSREPNGVGGQPKEAVPGSGENVRRIAVID